MNNNWYKKEKPLLGLTGLGGGVDGLAVVGAAAKTYIDDVFKTWLYAGAQGPNTLTTGLDMSGKGGLVWMKNRGTNATQNILTDTVRGANRVLYSDATNAENNDTGINQTFTSTGWTQNNGYTDTNTAGGSYASWNFCKQEGFFDIVTWTGDGGGDRVLSHNLGCIPGMIILKATSTSSEWYVYHREVGEDNYLELNDTSAAASFSGAWTGITNSQFPVKSGFSMNSGSATYVAYLFAGGASDAATARSVNFDGSNDGLSASSSDLVVGTGVFTAECWFKYDAGNTDRIISMDKTSNPTNRWIIYHHQGSIRLNINGSDVIFMGSELGFDRDQTQNWYHLALVKSADGYIRMYLNGNASPTVVSDSLDYQSDEIHIGMNPSASENFDGLISNVRLVVGTAVYTSSFIPPTEPLANITNTKILCCNNASVTGKTVGPTITATDSPTASTDSPFDDPNGFKFGADGDQNIIKCGSYIGSNNANTRVNVGWEPQWLLVRAPDNGDNWVLLDSMRGFVTKDDAANDAGLNPNANYAEGTEGYLDLTSTGFKTTDYGNLNSSGRKYIYIAIRRPDGYVAKPAEAGTEVFTMDTGNSSATIPAFDSTFPVDFALSRIPGSSDNWYATSRLTGLEAISPNQNWTGSDVADFVDDSNVGWCKDRSSSYQSWMWKRGAGFDVVTYKGDQVARRAMPHSLNAVPEMMWVKNREGTNNWSVYHKGLNDGTNPQNWDIPLNTDAAENGGEVWYYTAPTSTHVTLSADGRVNLNNKYYLMMLFSSVTGISKVDTYTGTGSSGLSVTTGFQPRFLIIKRSDAGSTPWNVYDSVRGFSSGNDSVLYLNTNNAATTNTNFGEFTSTGFTINETYSDINNNGGNYLYYAHA